MTLSGLTFVHMSKHLTLENIHNPVINMPSHCHKTDIEYFGISLFQPIKCYSAVTTIFLCRFMSLVIKDFCRHNIALYLPSITSVTIK